MKLKSKLITASASFFIMVMVLVVASRYDVSLLDTVASTQSAGVITGVNGATSSGSAIVGVTIPNKNIIGPFGFDIYLKNSSKKTVTYNFPDGLVYKYSILDAGGEVKFDSSVAGQASDATGKFILKSFGIKKITLQFDPVSMKLASGVYTIKAEFPGYGVGQNKFEYVDKTTAFIGPGSSPVRLPPVVSPIKPITTPGTGVTPAVSDATFSVTLNKGMFAVNEAITGKLTIVAGASPLKLSFTSGCQVATSLDGVQNSVACTMNLISYTIPAKSTKVLSFSQKGSATKGQHTLQAWVVGHSGRATLKVGVGVAGDTASAIIPLDGSSPVVTPTPPAPPIPPVVPTTTPSTTPPTLPPVELPPVSSGNEMILSANDKAGYATLSKTLEGYIGATTDQSDIVLMSALKEAIDGILSETSSADWAAGWTVAKPTKPSDLDIIVEPTTGPSPVYTQKKSFLASIFAAVKGLFVTQASNQRGYRVSGITVKNNKCHKYYDIDLSRSGSTIFQLSEKSVIAEKFKSIFRTKKVPTATELINQGGVCSAIATFDSLMKFDVAAASSESEFNSQRAVSPYDNSSYYIGTNEGKKVRNPKVLNTILANADLDVDPATGNWNTGNFAVASMHTVFNKYGPADFSCELYAPTEFGFQHAKEKIESCRTDIALSMGFPSGLGHIENIRRIETGNTQKTIYTTDAWKQGTFASDETKIPLSPGENKYIFTKDGVGDFKKLVSLNLSQISRAQNIKVNQQNAGLTWTTLGFLACTDKSDVIRNLDNMEWVKLENQKVNEFADFTVKTNAKYWLEWQKESNPWYDPKDAPNFSSCKKADVGAALKIYNSKLREWTIKWNKAAYDNRGYLTKAKRDQLIIERYWGAPGRSSGSASKPFL